MSGSSELTPEQTEWFVERFGMRMVRVQANADVPSRRQRRAMARSLKRRNDGTRKEG